MKKQKTKTQETKKQEEGGSFDFMKKAIEFMRLRLAEDDPDTEEGDDAYTEDELNGTQGNSAIEKE